MSNTYCSPKNSGNSDTCYNNVSLVKIAKKINSEYNDYIKIPTKITKKSRKNLWKNIKNKVQNKKGCNEDYCITSTNIVKQAISDKEIKETFRPIKPLEWNDNERKWLSTLDIRPVMKQYEQNNSDFKFIGPTPVDFDHKTFFGSCISEELCKINLKGLLKKNIYKLGVVFNMDPHYKSGSHWTSLYADFKKGAIYYFDSYGAIPPPEIRVLMNRIKHQGNTLLEKKFVNVNLLTNHHTVSVPYEYINGYQIKVTNPELFLYENLIYFGKQTNKKIILNQNTVNTIANKKGNIITFNKKLDKKLMNSLDIVSMKSFRTFYNNRKFQLKNTECGVYSMNFIDELLHGVSYDQFINNIIRDDDMYKNRNKYYRPNEI